MKELPKRFEANKIEPEIYQKWLKSGGFSPDSTSDAESRSILMPPPNANGLLHIGHAYEVAIQDAFIRYWRLKGYKTLWQPGCDHAGFETQIVFEKKLEKDDRSRFSIPRDELYREIYDFSTASLVSIRGQMERLGASADWSRFRFMLEPELVKTVYATFKSLYDDGLIYRAKRPVNWCAKHQTTLSDLEVKDEERQDPLYYIKYGPLVVATVRPETIPGDVALAVSLDDDRYKSYVGKTIIADFPFGKMEIPVIADEHVDPAFGTGVVKITPAHDPNDFEVGQRHNLPTIEVIDQFGKMIITRYTGQKIATAREAMVADLRSAGLIEKIDENYNHSVKVCYKCGTTIEPRILDQWWLSLTKTGKSGKCLRDLAVAAVESGETKFVSERFANQFSSWMKSLRDWPLSRQIVWGIQLPVWYDANGEAIVTDGSEPANASELTRDSDVFDTWFSSCQWPFSTLGNHSDDLKTFYPTTAMMPGYDILFFWVARMMMLSIYTQGKSPYQTIVLHGMVRDKDRQKMSKSKGNVIDPLGVAEEYGADAVRLALLFGNALGTDPVISEEKIRGMRNFVTKLWNIARFIDLSIDESTGSDFVAKTGADKEVRTALESTTGNVTSAMDKYQPHLALEALYQFIWHDLADTYLEIAKEQIKSGNTALTQANLLYVLRVTLILLHPFAPFVTEAIWQELFGETVLMNESWPSVAVA